MVNKLTPKQALFVKNISKGYNQTESAKLAGYSAESAYSQASRMLRNVKIVKALDRVGLTDTRIAEGIKTNAVAGEGIKATADTSIRAYELAARLKGYTSEKQEPTNVSQTNIYIEELKRMDDQTLREKFDQVQQEIIALKK